MAGLLDPVLGIFNNGGPDGPSRVDLDSGTKAMFDEAVRRANRDVSAFAGDVNQGMDRVSGIGSSRGMNPAAQSAISQVYGQQAGRDINQLKEKNAFNAHIDKANKLNQTTSMVLRQQAMKIQNMQALADAHMQNESARAGFVSSLAGLAGTAIGMGMGKKKNPIAPTQDAGGISAFNVQGMGALPASGGPAGYDMDPNMEIG